MNLYDKWPYWLRGGLIFTAVAFFVGSLEFVVASFLIGSIIGALFGYTKSRRLWKHWPYWLRGGVIAAAVTLFSVFLSYSCGFLVSGYGAIGCGVFIMFGPVYPVSWLMYVTGPIWGPIFHYDYTWLFADLLYKTVTVSVVFWFFIGSLTGALVGYIKSKIKK